MPALATVALPAAADLAGSMGAIGGLSAGAGAGGLFSSLGGMSGLSGVLGDVLSFGGGQQTNAQNMAIAQAQMAFQQKMLNQTEAYDTQMANTAVQRRKADLLAAGFNPLLATGQAASAPTVMGGQGAAIPMQNPSAAFQNIGNQISQGVNANTARATAQANIDNTNADTAMKMATLPYTGATAKQMLDNLQVQETELHAKIGNLEQNKQLIYEETFNAYQQGRLTAAQVQNQLQATGIAKSLFDIEQQQNEVNLQRARLGLKAVENENWFQNTWWGSHVAPFLPSILQSTHTGQGVQNMMPDQPQPMVVPRGASIQIPEF